jgi:hypothetical protein
MVVYRRIWINEPRRDEEHEGKRKKRGNLMLENDITP